MTAAITWLLPYPAVARPGAEPTWNQPAARTFLSAAGFRAACPARIDGTRDHHTLLVTFARPHGAELAADGLIRPPAAGELASPAAELKAHLADPATITLYRPPCQARARKPAPARPARSPPGKAALKLLRSAPCGMSERFRGARRVDVGQGEVSWVVMADPDGNEFDALRPLTPDELASG